ncbi:MAG: poly-gamma-glutamate system protein [Candidatus Eisenbacteria bacterium]|nr:poly-gamma-glutamate system protein [Candidatus Eisenbacteria bacterium]
MKYRPGRVHSLSLAALAVVGLGLFVIAERSIEPVVQPHFATKTEAAERTRLAMQAIREARFGSAAPVVNDPDETGLIGPEYSLITTDRGSHVQKLRALDPNLAGVFVHLLKEAGVGEGDLVAVGYTGAFPVMNAAALISIEAVGAAPVPVASVGASMWGANDPDLTWLDMERVLLERGIISHRSVAASRGGGGDRAVGLSPEGRRLIDEAIERNGIARIDEPTLEESIARRMEVYEEHAEGEDYACYFNVGGGLASIGSAQIGKLVKDGLTKRLEAGNFPVRGALVRMGYRGVPVIHVPRADELIDRYDLAGEWSPIPEVGTGNVFFRDRYNVPLAGVLAVLYAFLIFVVVRIDIKHYLFRRTGD